MAAIKFYLLPVEECASALAMHEIAREDALSAKRDLLSKYGADAILRAGPHVEAIAWKEMPDELAGFTIPRWSSEHAAWIQKPKKNTLRGKQAAREMDEVGELLEIWQWSLERALGVYGYIFGRYRARLAFLYAVANPLEDGRVVLSFPVRDHLDDWREKTADDPKLPSFATEITQEEAEKLIGKKVPELL
ncbi:hypothetical protein [Extensimonas sp. H3M7-6]|uniref:hypothetical protein n=1 Tax=Extensimonas soli TaxID=3031322 RepID=UPI0023DBA422|nr:hypothetical protein [Extensimonas sp. H3M7-6]MDF1482052.1 hypothetical protein [Extensimonas sp. H3M7-6]